MKSKILKPDMFEDERGTIRSFPIDVPAKEYNLMITKQGDMRGFHYHPHFDEYMLVVDGECEFTEFSDDGDHIKLILKVGDSVVIPKNTPHTFLAITDFKFVSLLTEQWDKSFPPIIKVDNNGQPI